MQSSRSLYSPQPQPFGCLRSRYCTHSVLIRKLLRAGGFGACTLFVILAILSGSGAAQTSLPFEVKNPKHKKWPEEQALKIYMSACELAARAIRPEQPPHLHPQFILILGADDNAALRSRDVSEIHLKNWMPEAFAQAVVVMAIRDVLPRERVADLTRSAVLSSETSVSVGELQQGH